MENNRDVKIGERNEPHGVESVDRAFGLFEEVFKDFGEVRWLENVGGRAITCRPQGGLVEMITLTPTYGKVSLGESVVSVSVHVGAFSHKTSVNPDFIELAGFLRKEGFGSRVSTQGETSFRSEFHKDQINRLVHVLREIKKILEKKV